VGNTWKMWSRSILNYSIGGRPSVDRFWNECFAQLVGTVLSLWDAAQLDAAGENGEVIPTFINLTDASIKMVHPIMGYQHNITDTV